MLDFNNVPQPDGYLRLLPECGGQTVVSESYVEGAPELIAEVAASSKSYDLHDKLNAYRRNGVREYVVWRVWDKAVDWFVLEDGQFSPQSTRNDGILRSQVFPGLWLDADAVIRGDLARVLDVLNEGLASPEHAEFVKQLSDHRQQDSE